MNSFTGIFQHRFKPPPHPSPCATSMYRCKSPPFPPSNFKEPPPIFTTPVGNLALFITNNQAFFHLWWKENLVKYQKVSNYYVCDCRSYILWRKGSVFTTSWWTFFITQECFMDIRWNLILENQISWQTFWNQKEP